MALKIQQLNADTTFLLTLSPSFAPERQVKRFPGDYRILLDPWLSGQSSVFHTKFQRSRHTTEPALTNLAHIKHDIDLIIISQDKPDHCHKETLCSLPKEAKVNILATTAAMKKILSWKHFDPRNIHDMKAYSPSNPDSIARITLPAYSSASVAGEITIANIPAKHDVTRLHNAIGITYQPPSTVFTLNTLSNRHDEGATAKLCENGITRPSTATQRPHTASSSTQPPSFDPLSATRSKPNTSMLKLRKSLPNLRKRADSGVAQPNGMRVNHEKVLSIVYTPHGVSPKVLEPYIRAHLSPLNAFPITAFLHSINVEDNPWLMGGRVAAGAPGGTKIAKVLEPRHWIGAHDEYKDNRGLATAWIKSRKYEIAEVREMLRDAGVGSIDVHRLNVGEVLRIPDRKDKEEEEERKRAKNAGLNAENGVPAMPMRTTNDIRSGTKVAASRSDHYLPLPVAYQRPTS